MDHKGLKLIGKGQFSKVYQLNEKQVLIKTVDSVKECISNGGHQSTGIFPELTEIERGMYVCKLYTKVRSLKEELSARHYAIYQDLRSITIPVTMRGCDQSDACREAFSKVKNKKYREALLEMIDELANYGTDVMFEISPRNVAVEKGKLILLDVFFLRSELQEIRDLKKRRVSVY